MKISIITAVYNSQETIAQAIQSVATQTYPDIQHVVVEGQSSDGSLQAIEAAAHPGMELTSEPDTGIYDALNKGIAQSTGDVIGFLHSDDFLPSTDVVSRIADAFASSGTEAVYSDLDYVSKTRTTSIVRHWVSGEFTSRRLKWGWMPPHPTLYLRRSVYDRVGLFDTTYRNSADYDFVLRYFSEAQASAVYIPDVLYKMRLGGESNRDIGKLIRKYKEDYRALKQNNVGGALTLASKTVSKLSQFFAH